MSALSVAASRFRTRPCQRQRGFTLVEMMVALALGLLIAAAAVASLIVARQGFNSVDGTTQLRENIRFASTMIEKIVVQAGFENVSYGLVTDPKDPGLRGFNNALVTSDANFPFTFTHDNRGTGCTVSDTSCVNGSDMLFVRFWGASRAGVADGTMSNCAGTSEPEAPLAQGPAFSVFHVQRGSNGEPTLMCSYREPATLAWKTVPLVQGVEDFQVLYGTDNVTANVCAADATTGTDSVAETYLTAKQLDGATGAYCANNWARVRSVRVGLLVRGPVGSANVQAAQTWSVLGDGSTYFVATATDPGRSLTTPADGRLRQQTVFTIHLRNVQSAQ